MFTGIVTHVGMVESIGHEAEPVIRIRPGFDPGTLALGASVAHAGVCLTVTSIEEATYTVQASAETMARTTLGRWQAGTRVNLERSLRLGDELGGHFVFGHVDGTAEIMAVEPLGQSWRLALRAPSSLAPFFAVKGSMALDGISLTVTEAGPEHLATVVIPHTMALTTLADRRVGDSVNLEVDMLARYVARQVARPDIAAMEVARAG